MPPAILETTNVQRSPRYLINVMCKYGKILEDKQKENTLFLFRRYKQAVKEKAKHTRWFFYKFKQRRSLL